ncbi:acetyl-CoA C-acetyltransferase [Arcicella lustrica]|uniref:Acetyl-CoA C-acetyltransferase n=1 Tax=Arcicella lustrica TaxID=2984196 RepID=A0ABU5SHW9_9BACT|nr:acetyl-CoA C-acetyltransferase [Arcicella sp. DC25W]MEA5426866.1 acetyl-CoA C-acetyltransferase [Arcicella sp. DC25W]
MNVAYIYDAVRTPRGRGKSDGSLHDIQPVQLAQQVLQQLRERNHLDTSLVDDVILGCVTPIGEQGADIARTAVLAAGYDQSVSGVQINRFCSSGLEAVNMAAAYIMSGQQELIIAGGIESMSRVTMGSDGGAMMMNPALIAEHKFVPQGISADLIATKYGYSREMLDTYAVESQKRAASAQQKQRFAKSMFTVKDDIGQEVLTFDEGMRPDTSLESLAKLKPAFESIGQMGLDHLALMKYPELNEIKHLHHAGNSSQIVDGAAGILIGNKAIGEKLGLKPRAKISAFGVSGSEPTIMLTGPIPATQKVLKRNGMNINDIDLFEINEAFAAIPLLFMDVLKVDASKVNVNGGAIALGHPLGATGAIILMTLLDELERTNKSVGLASLCIGGGMGIATVIERV